MFRSAPFQFLLALVPLLPAVAHGAQSVADEADDAATDIATQWGHSSHGAAYDEGPRQRPWVMEGIGSTPFPISSANPEVQAWFDQGVALLHSFWFYEAERSFRWCLKLDPECAMAYWGMALATQRSGGRDSEFIDEAVARKDGVTDRERAFIEVTAAFHAAKGAEEDARDDATREAMVVLDELLMDHPDDVEAKALYWLVSGEAMGRKGALARYGLEAVLDDILEIDPDHVGALHYRIHNWDGKEGRYAVESCMRLGDLAPNSGHLLHMPGHVLSGIGMWHEAAIAMDRATRVEKAYMRERMIVPEDNWDYVHNLDYLGYIQEQLGMVDAALFGAEQLVTAPAFSRGEVFRNMTRNATVRALVKFERWEEILEPGRIEWDESNALDRIQSLETRFRANIGVGDLDAAQDLLDDLTEVLNAPSAPPTGPPDFSDPKALDRFLIAMMTKQAQGRLGALEGLLLLAEGEHLDGLAKLTAAAEAQVDDWENDPPSAPNFLYTLLGDQYLALGAPRLAVECYERTLETVIHDGFALAGLVVAHAQLGETDQARAAMAKLRVVWSDADRPNRWLEAAEATGIEAEPRLDSPVPERNYRREVLDRVGPSAWIPTAAPELSATNAQGEPVTLADYRGKSVVAIFYLGDECVHCMEQLAVAEEHLEAIEALDAVVLAISKDDVEEISGQADSFGLTLLSDPTFASAHRFQSYDDFEEIELHSTFLIDPLGRVHWSRIGGEPFVDFDFIESELASIRRADERSAAVSDPSPEVPVESGPAESETVGAVPGGTEQKGTER